MTVVGNERIYWGLFQANIDSYGSQNPVIMLSPQFSRGEFVIGKSITIHRSYFDGEGLENTIDPRADIRIYNALKSEGILIK